jgi:FtsH-binding integral membrane protein
MHVNTGVFDRDGADEIKPASFYAALTISLLWGLALTAIVAYLTMKAQYAPGWGGVIVYGLVIPIIGIFIAVKSENPLVSFIGYNMLVIPFGAILGPVLNHYSPNVIRNAFGITAGITFLMGFAGTCFPNLFKNLGAPLFLALSGLLIVRIAQIFVPELASLTFIDYIAAGIFTLYIGFDMYRASAVPKTLDNAVDISLDLYLDVVNLFLTLLRILGESRKSSCWLWLY